MNKTLFDKFKIKKDSHSLDLLSFVSHELKSPLSTLKLNVELLKKQISPENKNLLDMMDKEVEWMIQFISDTLDLGERKLDLKWCSWQAWFKLIEVDMLTKAHLHNKKLKIEGLKEEVQVQMDPFYIRQALWNLLMNALEHAPNGSTIEILCQKNSRSKELTICVQDEGEGLNSETKIFQPFYRRKKEDETIKGSGLGLTIVKKIIEAHGGKVFAQNRQESKGAFFKFTLPQVQSF